MATTKPKSAAAAAAGTATHPGGKFAETPAKPSSIQGAAKPATKPAAKPTIEPAGKPGRKGAATAASLPAAAPPAIEPAGKGKPGRKPGAAALAAPGPMPAADAAASGGFDLADHVQVRMPAAQVAECRTMAKARGMGLLEFMARAMAPGLATARLQDTAKGA